MYSYRKDPVEVQSMVLSDLICEVCDIGFECVKSEVKKLWYFYV